MRFERSDVVCTMDEQNRLTPGAFTVGGSQRLVEHILDRWYEGGMPGRPEVSYFRVSTAQGGVYILRYAAIFDAWAVLLGQRA